MFGACGPAVLDVLFQTSPSLEGPSDVGCSPFVAEGPSFFCPRHTWLGRIAVCLICALCYGGWAALVFYLILARDHSVFFSGCGLAGMPLHVPLLGLGRTECPVYVLLLGQAFSPG